MVSAETDDMYFTKTIRDALKFDFTSLAMCLSLHSGARFDRGVSDETKLHTFRNVGFLTPRVR